MNQDPIQEDFFNTQDLGDFSAALVREAIQNSLDAGAGTTSDPVKVRIALPADVQRPTISQASHFFDGLVPHVEASGVAHDAPDVRNETSVDFLTFEDFGTRGLLGDPKASEDPAEGEAADFYYFWRNIGRAGKSGEQRGRWGLGKTMFPAAGRLHSFFGFTVRESDNRALLMGQSVLSIHRLDGTKHYPYGYFGVPDGEDNFIVPIEDSETIDRFKSLFNVSRDNEPGLSVVVPFPRKDIENNNLIHSIVDHYFFPILAGELIVEVYAGNKVTEISDATIEETADKSGLIDRDEFRGTLQLAGKYMQLSEHSITHANTHTPRRSPLWNEDLFSSAALDELAQRLDSGDAVAVRVPVHVIPSSGAGEASYFDLVLERDGQLERSVDYFIRSGITISGIHSLRDSGIRALVVVRDRALSEMLGDAENPAHTEWQDRSRNFRGKYQVGKSTLAFVRDAPRGFMRLINKRSEQIDDTTLRHIFPNPTGSQTPRVRDPAPGTEPDPTKSPRPRPDIPKRTQILRTSRVGTGFRVQLTDHGRASLPCTVRIRMAYDVRRGNPFKNWVPADFRIEDDVHELSIVDGAVIFVEGNTMEVRAEQENFQVTATKFDPQRDLVLDVRLKRESNA